MKSLHWSSAVRGVWPRVIAFSFALAVCGSAGAETSDAGWRWSVTPYIWGSDVSADVRFPSGQEVGGRLTFNDILDDLDLAALVHLEGHRGEWGMLFDVTYLEMSDSATHGPISSATDTEFGVYELAGVYTPEAAEGFSVLAGARVVDVALDLTLTPPAPFNPIRRSLNESFTDLLLGARYVFALGDRWALNVRGDVGVGETAEDWGATAQIGWRFGSELQHAVLFGWRHLEIEVRESSRRTDVSFDGPLVGVMFGW
jgi:hypothetical protein